MTQKHKQKNLPLLCIGFAFKFGVPVLQYNDNICTLCIHVTHTYNTLKWKQESVVTLKTRLWRKQREHVSRAQYRSCVHTHRQ